MSKLGQTISTFMDSTSWKNFSRGSNFSADVRSLVLFEMWKACTIKYIDKLKGIVHNSDILERFSKNLLKDLSEFYQQSISFDLVKAKYISFRILYIYSESCIECNMRYRRFHFTVDDNTQSYYEEMMNMAENVCPELNLVKDITDFKINISFSGGNENSSSVFNTISGRIFSDILGPVEKHLTDNDILLYLDENQIGNIIKSNYLSIRNNYLDPEFLQSTRKTALEKVNYLSKGFSEFIFNFNKVIDETIKTLIKKNENMALKNTRPIEKKIKDITFIQPNKNTYPRYIPKKEIEKKKKLTPKNNDVQKEDIIFEPDERIKEFFSQRGLTVDQCLNFLGTVFSNCVTRKKRTYFVMIPPRSPEFKEAYFSDSTISVTLHPGHDSIEEHNIPYYVKELRKSLKDAGWL